MEPEEAAEWPNISSEKFHQYWKTLQDGAEHLHRYLKQAKLLDKDTDVYVKLYGQVTSAYMHMDWSLPHIPELSEEIDPLLFSDRPAATLSFNQLACSLDTTWRRCRQIMKDVDYNHGKVFCLGDDDLLSVGLSAMYEGEIHMLDLDPRLLAFIEQKAPSVHRHVINLEQGGMPEDFYQSFDAVTLDPHWYYHGAISFLEKALFCLKDAPNARIYMSICPLFTGSNFRKLQQKVLNMGLVFHEIKPFFNWYELDSLDSPNAREMFDKILESYPSALLTALKPLPYGFSHLYILRKDPDFRPSSFRKWWFKKINML